MTTWSSRDVYERGRWWMNDATVIEQGKPEGATALRLKYFGAFSQGSRWRDNPGLWDVTASR
ncbi:MAG TPA: hypothetical protein VI306_12675 [Pyrinomonadaceae bacterium]